MLQCKKCGTQLEEVLIVNAGPNDQPKAEVCWKCSYDQVMALSNEKISKLFPTSSDSSKGAK